MKRMLPRLLAGVLVCLLAGCGAPSSGIVLRLATTQAGEQMREPFRQALSRFEQAHPGVRVQLQEMSDEVYQQMGLVTLFAGGTPPDIYFQWGGYGVRRYAAAGYALDLTPQFTPGERSRYYPACWSSAAAADGHVYLWPDASSITTVFWYRASLFRRLGLREPQSWGDLLGTGERLREAGVIPLAVGNRELWPGANLAANLCAQQAGVERYNAVLGLQPGTRLDDPAFIAAFTRLAELRERGLLNRGVDGTGTDEARSLLSQGKAAMHPIGDWLATEADAADAADLDAFRLPRLPEQQGKDGMLLALTTGYMVYRRSPHPELAVALLRSLTRDDVQQNWARHGHLSAVRSAAPGADAAPGMRRLVSFLNTAPESAIAPDVGFNPEVADAFMDAAALVLGGKATPESALANAERQVSALREGLNRQDAKVAKNSGGDGGMGAGAADQSSPIRPHSHTPKPLRASASPW